MEIEIPFGAFDSELMHQEITIPEGFEATIEGNKIILTKTENEEERIGKEILDCFRAMKQQGCFPSKHKEQYDSWLAWLEKQGKHSIYNVPSREVVLAIWDLGNEWKELTNGSISTEYGTQLDYIQKHWHESEYYLKEKQGEQNDSDVKDYNSIDPNFAKPIDKVEPKFKNGQWIVWQNKCYKVNYNGCGYELIDQNGLRTSLEYGTVDKSAHLLTIDDVKDSCKLGAKWQKKNDVSEDWGEEDEKILNEIFSVAARASLRKSTLFGISYDYIKWQNWLKSLKDRVQPQPKQEWGKEDIRNIENIDSVLFYDKDLPEDTCVRLRNWLKSLIPQKQWKPSKEQMEVLVWCMPLFIDPKSKAVLESLIKDLKKL
jgi:hypothetical protein